MQNRNAWQAAERRLFEMPASPRDATLARVHLQILWRLRAFGGLTINRLLPLACFATPLIFGGGWPPNLGQLLLSVSLGGVALAVREAIHQSALIMPLSVPPSFPASGMTGEVAASRLLDAARASVTVRDVTDMPGRLMAGQPLPQLELPGMKLSLEGLADVIRSSLGWPRTLISGEIIEEVEGRISIRVRGLAGFATIECPDAPRHPIDEVLRDLGENLPGQLIPTTGR